MSDLDAIFFDIDDTLYSTSEFAARARMNAAKAMRKAGLALPAEHLYQELVEIVREFGSNYDHHFDKLLFRLPRRALEGINPAILIAAGVSAYHDTKVRELSAYPDAVALLKRLAGTEIVRGVITSGLEVKQAEKLIRLEVYRYFTPTAIFISDQTGFSKPNPKLFLRACESIGVSPSGTIYVGDDPAQDIEPAAAAGLIPIWIRRGPKAERQSAPKGARAVLADFNELGAALVSEFRMSLPP